MLITYPEELQARRIGFGGLARNPPAGRFKRLKCLGLLDVDHRVELVRRADMEVVALPFRLRQIDHADGAGQSDHIQCGAGGAGG